MPVLSTITDSTIGGSTTGILVGSGSSDTSTLTADNDSFAGDTVGVQNNQSGGQVTTSMDWWGSSTGPTSRVTPAAPARKCIGSVNFSPWLGDANIVTPDYLVFLSTAGEAFVVTPNSGNTSLGVSLGGVSVDRSPAAARSRSPAPARPSLSMASRVRAAPTSSPSQNTSVEFNAADGLSGTTINFSGTERDAIR